MKIYIQPIIMGLVIGTLSPATYSTKGDIEIKPVKIVEPEEKQREVQSAAIDSESFELGLMTGFLSVEDFNNNLIVGLSGSYHFNQHWLFQLNYGQSDIEKSTFEEVIDSSFLKNNDRKFKYYNITAGYNMFPGRSFFGKNAKYNSGIYLTGGIGNTSFAASNNTTLSIGSSYRTVITDWLTCNIDFKDHIMEREFLNDDKITHNIELSIGINMLF